MELRKLNAENNQLNWDELHYDAWDVFKAPQNITLQEKTFALSFLGEMKLDIDDEHVICFRAKASHFCNMAVQLYRKAKSDDL